jgi:2,3-bisphosphoglycerate-independent phosphoglycerate mutase
MPAERLRFISREDLMKYVVLLGDGMADEPIAALNGKTPLEHAHTPFMDRLARDGEIGLAQTIPPGFPPGSDVANLSVFGYDPRICYSGRSPLEAASMGVTLGASDVAFRLNLVTLGEGPAGEIMEDFSAGHITTEEARQLLLYLQESLGSREFQFFPGVSYRHLLVWREGRDDLHFTPPHDISGQPIGAFLPSGDGAPVLMELAGKARRLLAGHPVNQARLAAGKKPANAIWLWGHGRAPQMEPITTRYGLTGAVISAVDLIKGIGIYAGLDVINVPGATGYLDTNYLGKAEYALEALRSRDYIYLHVEAPDEASHGGLLQEKIQAIEDFDRLVVGTMVEGLRKLGPFRVLVLPDHPTPLAKRTHTSDAVPYILYGSAGEFSNSTPVDGYHERAAEASGRHLPEGHRLMERLVLAAL